MEREGPRSRGGEDARVAEGRGRGRENVWRVSRHLRGGGEEYSWNLRMARRVCEPVSESMFFRDACLAYR